MDYCHFLDVLKPRGMSSFAVVSRVRRLAGTKRVGHLGTLDPMAEGVLPLALGRATRLIEYVSGDKRYTAEVTLGITTDTLDAEGNVTETRDAAEVQRPQVEEALRRLEASTEQVPPMASALHHEGKRLYELFRAGRTVDVPARPVRIDGIALVEFAPPRLVLDVRCGAGTYIRSIARDLGEMLGCGAHLSALSRTRRGPFAIDAAVSLERLEQDGLAPWLLPPARVVDGLAWLAIDAAAAVALRHGKRITLPGREDLECVPPGLPFAGFLDTEGRDGALYALADTRGELIAIGRLTAGEIQPLKVFAGAEGEST